MPKVKFNDVTDFLAELSRDAAAGEVDRGIVRLTRRWRRVEPAPFQSLAVVASYTCGDQVVLLEAGCGTFLPDLPEAEKVKEIAAKLVERIEDAARMFDLQVRAGVFE